MARLLRLEYSGALPHLTARGNDQQPIVHDETDRMDFLKRLGQEVLQQRWRSAKSSNDHIGVSLSVLRFTRKRRKSAIAAEALMKNAGQVALSMHLHFDNVSFQGLHEGDHLATLRLGNFKGIQGRIDMPHKRRPIGFTYLHSFMRNLHVPPGVVHGSPGTRTEKINQELFFALEAVLSSMFPETFQPRIRH